MASSLPVIVSVYASRSLLFLPLLGLFGVVLALYGTPDEWSKYDTAYYDRFISERGMARDPHHSLFTLGFIIAASSFVTGYLIKTVLMKLLWKWSCLLIFDCTLAWIGAIGLIIMASYPFDVSDEYLTIHNTGTAIGVPGCVLTLFIDALYWFKYLRFKQLNSGVAVFCVHCYSVLCPTISVVFLVRWASNVHKFNEAEHESYEEQSTFWFTALRSQWLCVLFLCMGFLIPWLQAIWIHQHVKQLHAEPTPVEVEAKHQDIIINEPENELVAGTRKSTNEL